MIDVAEIRQRALTLGLSTDHVTRDYLMCHVLAAVAESPGPLVFRGGTALARVYWPDHRLSEDLDFILLGNPRDAEPFLEHAVRTAARRAGVELELQFVPQRSDLSRSWVGWRMVGAASPEGEKRLLIDIAGNEHEYLPAVSRLLDLPYGDLQPNMRSLPVTALAEILGNKWHMLVDDDRKEPRDLFDIWFGLCRAGIPFADVARGHLARYHSRPQAWHLERARRLGPAWEIRLAPQVREVPSFDDALSGVESALHAWQAETRDAP